MKGVATVTILRADVLAGLTLAADVGSWRRDRHGCRGEVGGGAWSPGACRQARLRERGRGQGTHGHSLTRSNEVFSVKKP
jgi:hypothetical protein